MIGVHDKVRASLPKKCNPYDYLSASARARMLSNKIITKGRLLQMIHANDLRQAFQILNTADIGVGVNPEDYEHALAQELVKAYGLVRDMTDSLTLFDIFRYKYDGQNIKFVLKSKTVSPAALHSMTDLGTVRKEDIVKGINNDDIPGLPPEISQAIVEARENIASRRDPQKADIIIDKAVLCAMHRIAHKYDNRFFQKVVCSLIDIENIRSLVRAKRAGKDSEFLGNLLSLGGYIETDKLIKVFPASMREIAALIRSTRYGYALETGLSVLDTDDTLTTFEKVCDNYMLTFIREANRVVFGIEPILGYILEKENEITSIRLVMAAKMVKSPASAVIERLREHAW